MNLYNQNGPELGDGFEEPTGMTFEEAQEYKASCEHVIRQSDAALRLAKNPDFVTLIMEGYFTEEPKRLGMMMASGRINEKQIQGCMEDLRGIGNLRAFLASFIQKGEIAKGELANLEAAIKAATEGEGESE